MKRILTIVFALALLAPAIAQAQTLTPFERNGRWGYENANWREVITPKYDYAHRFSEGLAAVKLNDKLGFIDKAGRVVIPLMYEGAGGFSEGLAAVKVDGKCGFIDKTGRVVIPLMYELVGDFSEGLAAVRSRSSQHWGFIDKTGRVVIPLMYENVMDFSGGLAVVRSGKLWGLIDRTGREILAPQFDEPGAARKLLRSITYVATNVKEEIQKWEQKDEFETVSEYNARVNMETRSRKTKELFDHYAREYATSYEFSFEVSLAQNKGYDAERQTVLMSFPTLGELVVKMPDAAAARSLKENWDKVAFSAPEFVPVKEADGTERIVLASLTVTNPANNAKHTWNIHDDYAWGQTVVKSSGYEFVSLADAFGGGAKLPTGDNIRPDEIIDLGPSDVDIDIPETGRTKPKTYALVIGNEDYTLGTGDASKNIPFAAADATIFAEYCTKTLGIPADNIRREINATAAQMARHIRWLAEKASIENGEAELIFYYSGHGLPGESIRGEREPYLIPADLDGNDLSQAIALSDLYAQLGSGPTVKTTVILDACFSGEARATSLWAGTKAIGITPDPAAPRGNTIAFASSSGNERSGVYSEKKHGYFTYFLLKKLQETSGAVTYGEMFSYIHDNVKRASHNTKLQTPGSIPSPTVANTWENWKFNE
jgi:hypothetical protein